MVGSAALVGLGSGALADSHATEIGCTTIKEPGVYHLTGDLSGSDGNCLIIQSHDVTIDGQGHTIANASRFAIMAEDDIVRNLTIRNLEITDPGERGISIGSMEGGLTIRDVTVTNASGLAVAIGPEMQTGHIRVEGVTTTDSRVGLFVGDVATATVRDVTLRDNDEAGLWSFDSAHAHVEDATIAGNQYGVHVELGGTVDATNIEIRDNDVGVFSGQDTPGAIDIHRSVIAGNGVGADSLNRRDNINLTHNYWGTADGPSSVGDELVADPETGTLANGSGDSVAGLDGEAVARFDPWLAVPALSDEFAGPPQDLNGDGLYEDVNGDGAVNVGDAQALFAFEDAAIVQEHAALFDFNGDDTVNVGDAQALFAQVTA